MYTPDRSFMNRLKTLDRNLGCHWNGVCFVITYQRSYGDPVTIWVVKPDPGQEFRQPDQRDLDTIMASDVERESPKDKHQRVAAYMEDYQAKKRTLARENIRYMTRENRTQLINAFGKVDGQMEQWRVGSKPQRVATTIEQMSS